MSFPWAVVASRLASATLDNSRSSFPIGSKHTTALEMERLRALGFDRPWTTEVAALVFCLKTKSCHRLLISKKKKKARDQDKEGDVVVVGVLIKGMDYLFASQWHFACLPNSCCEPSIALAWLTAWHWLYLRHIWSYTWILLPTDSFTATHSSISPRLFIPVSVEKPLKKPKDGTHTEC